MILRFGLATQLFFVCILIHLQGVNCVGDDWPTWRGGAGRMANTKQQLAKELYLRWDNKWSALQPAWPEDTRLQFDKNYEPIVVGKTMFVASARDDSVTALNTETGLVRWEFVAEGPVRLAPLAHKGRIYFGADDGCLYCLAADTGSLVWKFQAAPGDRRAIGNERVISVWPVRGGLVLVDDTLYFTAGVWPFEGTQLYSLRLDGDNAPNHQTVKSSILKDFAPQGYLAASENRLFIPGGRANAYCQNLDTGKQVGLRYSAKGTADYHITAMDQWMFHGGKIVDTNSGLSSKLTTGRPVGDDGKIYFTNKGVVHAYDLKNPDLVKVKDRKGKEVAVEVPRLLWRLKDQAITQVHVKAGQRIFAHHGHEVIAIDLPTGDDEQPVVSWKTTIEGTPASMLVADEKLFVVTREGSILCYGTTKTNPTVAQLGGVERKVSTWSKPAGEILKQTGVEEGYCLALGIGSGGLINELVRQSKLHVLVIDPDAKKVDAFRRSVGLYGTRVSAIVGDPATITLPPYMASLIVAEEPSQLKLQPKAIANVYATLRPYGGTICLGLDDKTHPLLAKAVADAKLSQAKIHRSGALTQVVRAGALPGAANWTHEFGDVGNTLMSRDSLVKAPLGVLWFGGPSAMGELFYDRHRWGPSLAVIEGRMYLQGPKKLTAVDVYTGRVLWKLPLIDGVSPGRRSNWGATGFHFVAETDAIYLAYPDKCLRIDPKTGKQLGEFTLADKEDEWGRFLIQDDLLLVPVFRKGEDGKRLVKKLVALDRTTGKVRWSQDATASFSLVALGKKTAFCIDADIAGLFKGDDKKQRREGVVQSEVIPTLKALDLATGEQRWERTTPRVPEWLAYSQQHDVLVTSNRTGVDAWQGKDGKELWRKDAKGNGFRGHPENYYGRVILWKDQVLDQRGPGAAYSLLTGKPTQRIDPITEQQADWEFTKIGHHCNYAIASEHLMTFRAADAGFADLNSGGATGRLTGFRSACRNSLIPADGVLNAPNMAHGCTCSFSIFTSLALVHVENADLWTYGAYKAPKGKVERVGINLGAEGDRRDDQGTMWLDFPNVGGPSPNVVPKVVTAKLESFRFHTAKIKGDGLPWVAASGAKGISSVTIPLTLGDAAPKEKQTYTVRLYFLEPTGEEPGTNQFDVEIGGKAVLTDFDVVKEAGGPMISIVKEFQAIPADRELVINLTAKKGATVLSGIEVVAE